MGLTAMIFGRGGGKRALREWATDVWQDWQAGATEYWMSGAEYLVCPVCWYRYRLIDDDSTQNHQRLWMLVQTAPAMPPGGPPPSLDPGGWKKAEGCRCWRGYSHSARHNHDERTQR